MGKVSKFKMVKTFNLFFVTSQLAKEINKRGKGKCLFIQGDVTSEADQLRALHLGFDRFGEITHAFANAGVVEPFGFVFRKIFVKD